MYTYYLSFQKLNIANAVIAKYLDLSNKGATSLSWVQYRLKRLSPVTSFSTHCWFSDDSWASAVYVHHHGQSSCVAVLN